MPRDGSDVYYIPPGTEGVPDATIESAKYNVFLADIEQDLNLPRPIVAGGTGENSAEAALAALGGEMAYQVIVNFDSHVYIPGSFYAASSATGGPVASRPYAGIIYQADAAGKMVVEARDLTTNIMYSRTNISGTWSAWEISNVSQFVKKSGDTMTGHLSLPVSPAAANAVRKDYVDTAAGAAAAYTPSGNIAANTVQGAIAELDTEKVAKAGDTMSGHLSLPTGPAAANAVRKDYVDAADTALSNAIAAIPSAPAAATAAEFIANSEPTKMLTPGAVWSASNWVQATPSGSTFTLNLSAGIDFWLQLTAVGMTMANPTNLKPGQKGIVGILQDATGNRTITTWGAKWKFPGGVKPTLTAAASAYDLISYFTDGVSVYCTFSADMK
jgi:hypothetical protein